ncbi:MAG TPA: hypothetical protein VKO16_11630 [Polyangia bacterium]|nr:hypothetical protein [Polyangia bacterium]
MKTIFNVRDWVFGIKTDLNWYPGIQPYEFSMWARIPSGRIAYDRRPEKET